MIKEFKGFTFNIIANLLLIVPVRVLSRFCAASSVAHLVDRAGNLCLPPDSTVATSIPVPERYYYRYQFYNINSNKKEITLHTTVQIFSFIFQLSIFPIQAFFLQKKLIKNNFQCKTVANR